MIGSKRLETEKAHIKQRTMEMQKGITEKDHIISEREAKVASLKQADRLQTVTEGRELSGRRFVGDDLSDNKLRGRLSEPGIGISHYA